MTFSRVDLGKHGLRGHQTSTHPTSENAMDHGEAKPSKSFTGKYTSSDQSDHLFFGMESFTGNPVEGKGDDHFTILNRKVNF